MKIAIAAACLLFFCHAVIAADTDGQKLLRQEAADALKTVPATQPAPGFTSTGVRAMFFTGPTWRGKPTRVFAWYGLPANYVAGTKIPAVVLVHGATGTAFARWVRLWTKRGYAALAMDTCGQLPRGKPWQRDPRGGPPGWGGFDQVNEPVADQWPVQAELDVILADSLVRSFPEVDDSRVGIVGISWGGYLTCIAADLDPRFRFAISVYGCGFLGEDSAWLPDFQKIGATKSAAWLAAFDPSHYLPGVTMPMLWIDGTNDVNYPLESLAKSYVLPTGPATRVTKVGLKHSHTIGWSQEEVYAYAGGEDGIGPPLIDVLKSGADTGSAWTTFGGQDSIAKAELNYTTDAGDWKLRNWQTTEANLAPGRASAKLPAGTTAWFINLIDARGLVVSSKVNTVP